MYRLMLLLLPFLSLQLHGVDASTESHHQLSHAWAASEAGAPRPQSAFANQSNYVSRVQYNFSVVVTANDSIKSCYRNPVLVQTRSGSLLCFVEERSRGYDWTPSSGSHSCSDNYKSGRGGHNLGYLRSTDVGATWSPIVRLAGNLSNLIATGGIDYTNNAVIPTHMPDESEMLLYQFGTQNNPSAGSHGQILQQISTNDGLTWTTPTDVSSAGTSVGYPGATPGPAAGVQIGRNLVFCNWGNNFRGTHEDQGWKAPTNFANFLTISTDYGKTWRATKPTSNNKGWNECFIASLPNSTDDEPQLLEISRQSHAHAYGAIWFSGKELERQTIPTYSLPGMDTPICEGSLVARDGFLYFSHPQSSFERTNLTIHRSENNGRTWPVSILVWAGSGSGYSSMTATTHGLALAFNSWPTNNTHSSKDGPGQSIRFTMIRYNAFDFAKATYSSQLNTSTCLPCCVKPPVGQPCCCPPPGCPVPPSCPPPPSSPMIGVDLEQ